MYYLTGSIQVISRCLLLPMYASRLLDVSGGPKSSALSGSDPRRPVFSFLCRSLAVGPVVEPEDYSSVHTELQRIRACETYANSTLYARSASITRRNTVFPDFPVPSLPVCCLRWNMSQNESLVNKTNLIGFN